MTSAEKSIIPEFNLTLDRLNIRDDFHVTKNVIRNNRTGSFIYFSGIKTSSGDQTANLKSISGITTWVIEEGEDFDDEKTFDSIDDSIRTKGMQNRIIWIQNPSTSEHFAYKRWIEPRSKQLEVEGYKVTASDVDNVEAIHTTYHIGTHYLSEDWIYKAEKAKKDNPKWYYHNYIGGWLDRADGVIFENWEEGDFDETVNYCYGQDYGYSPDPYCLVKVGVCKKRKLIFIKEISYKNNLSTNDIVNIYKEEGLGRKLIVTDINEPRTTNELRSKGFNLENANKNRIVDDIRVIQGYKIIVDPDSTNVKRELRNYVWNDKKKSVPIDDYNHCFTGDTLITILGGVKRIDKMEVGDLVLTSKGYKRVLKVFDNGLKQVNRYSMETDIFDISLCSTKEHKVKTKSGWTKISKLKKGQELFIHKNLWVRLITYIMGSVTSLRDARDCTGLFGSTITDILARGMIFIILTVIQLTTILKTSLSYLVNFMQGLQLKKELRIIKIGLKNFTRKGLKKQRNGTHQRKVGHGIVSNQKKVGSIDHTELSNVRFVGKSIKQDTLDYQNIATKTARLKHLEIGESWKERVYDIMVEDCHEYYANGLLVHNCLDPMRYSYNKLMSNKIIVKVH